MSGFLTSNDRQWRLLLQGLQLAGAGVRQARHAMADSGNPPLLFGPPNDTDGYTVACPTSEEFALIRDREDEAAREASEKTTTNAQETPEGIGSASEKASETMPHYLRSNQKASAKETDDLFGRPRRAVVPVLRPRHRLGTENPSPVPGTARLTGSGQPDSSRRAANDPSRVWITGTRVPSAHQKGTPEPKSGAP